MSLPRIASTLLSRLDSLLAAVAGDAPLVDGLQRERARLCEHLDRHAAELRRLERTAHPPLPSLSQSSPAQPCRQPPSLRPDRVARLAEGLRLQCYSALDGGLLDARRFDTLLLLGARARRCAEPRPAYAGSSSVSGSSSAGAGVGVSVGSGPAGSGRSGGMPGVPAGIVGWSPGASLRRNRISSSTMRPCV